MDIRSDDNLLDIMLAEEDAGAVSAVTRVSTIQAALGSPASNGDVDYLLVGRYVDGTLPDAERAEVERLAAEQPQWRRALVEIYRETQEINEARSPEITTDAHLKQEIIALAQVQKESALLDMKTETKTQDAVPQEFIAQEPKVAGQGRQQ